MLIKNIFKVSVLLAPSSGHTKHFFVNMKSDAWVTPHEEKVIQSVYLMLEIHVKNYDAYYFNKKIRN